MGVIETIPLRQSANAIGGKQTIMLQTGPNGGVIADIYGTDFQGNNLHQSYGELQEEKYNELSAFMLRKERATLPPFSHFKTGNTLGRVVGESGASPVPATKANPPVKDETEEEGTFWAKNGEAILDGTQVALDVAGLIPVVGDVADVASGLVSLARGDYVGAGLSFASAIPFAGWAASGAKAARRAMKSEKAAAKATKELTEEGAEKEAKDLAEKEAKDLAEERAKEAGEAAPGKKVKQKKPLECGQKGPYGKLQEFDAESVGLERDHIPPQAALLQRALQIARSKEIDLDAGERRALKDRIGRHAFTVSVPKEIHGEGLTNSNQNNKLGASDLQKTAHDEAHQHRENMRRSDKHHKCLGALQKATGEIGKITNKQYDQFLDKVLDDFVSGKRTTDPWKNIL
ncbi:hypothetical protein [Xanthomonas cerealis]|uniref:hypothetical protein n=1 Tax=Xanthomonas cerealis TaxID=3390025 RepID=UPI00163C5D58|nr:hypothetical protein [Xanthomonas translucens]